MKRILLLEGNTNIRDFMKRELTKGGYSVLDAADGNEASHRLKEDNPDILIVDVVTKKKKALEAFRGDVAAAQKKLPLLVLTAKAAGDPDLPSWKAAFVIERSGSAAELLAALEKVLPPPPPAESAPRPAPATAKEQAAKRAPQQLDLLAGIDPERKKK